jgi:mono/diheme cytochrome c family protein
MRYLGWLFLLLWSCGGSNNRAEGENAIRFRQYMVQGQQLYLQHCSNCHQAEGTGLAQLYPPLAQSDYMLEDVGRTVCLIKYGLTGEIMVNGRDYNLPMPANPQLTDIEIAEIATYIYNAWGNQHGLISVTEVTQMLNTCDKNMHQKE